MRVLRKFHLLWLFGIFIVHPSANCAHLQKIQGLINAFQMKYINISASLEILDKRNLFNLSKLILRVCKSNSLSILQLF